MAATVLVLLGGDLDGELIPRYQKAQREGTLSIAGYAKMTETGLSLLEAADSVTVQGILVSFSKMYDVVAYMRRYAPEIPREALLDGRIFRMEGLDVPRLLRERVGYAPLEANPVDREEEFSDLTRSELPRVWSDGQRRITLGAKSYFGGHIEWGYRGGAQEIRIGNYTSFGGHCILEVGMNNQHDYRRVTTYDPGCMDFDLQAWSSAWGYKSSGGGIHVGSDVWVGRGCRLKAAGDRGILTIGDGAVLAADSVVVKDVPPYAIVGGNPARVIKYRFSQELVDAFLKLRWWEWPVEKIYDNLKEMNDPRAFLKKHGFAV